MSTRIQFVNAPAAQMAQGQMVQQQCFLWQRKIYMQTSDSDKAVELATGYLQTFNPRSTVVALDVDITVATLSET